MPASERVDNRCSTVFEVDTLTAAPSNKFFPDELSKLDSLQHSNVLLLAAEHSGGGEGGEIC